MVFQFQLSQNHLDYQNSVKDLLDSIQELNESDIIKKLANEGYLSLPGLDNSKSKDYLSLTLTVEEIAKVYPKVANVIVELLFAQEVVKSCAEPECKSGCLNKIRTLEKRINILYSEPCNYSVASLSTKIEKTESGYKVTGKKIYAPENAGSDVFLVLGNLVDGEKVKPAFAAVPFDKVKFETKEIEHGKAKFSIELADIDVEVEHDKVLLNISNNLRSELSVWRTLIAASAIGIAHSNLVTALSVAKTVKSSSKQAISASQAVQFNLSDMFAEIEAARMLTYYSSALVDAGNSNVKISSMAKVQASEAAVFSSNQAASILGNVGNIYDPAYLELLQLAYNRQIKDGTTVNSHNLIYEEALAKR